MQAEVQDRYSGPLKALRAQLLDTARTGNNHSETLAKGFGAVEGALQKTARTASSVVNPAFAALGVTGLTAGAAVAGISAALNKLTTNMSGLGQLSRESGVAAKTLQEFSSVAGRFGIEQDAVAAATKNFAAQMRTFSIGTGDAFNWVIRQGRDAAGRKAFQDFATDLQHTSDEGEKLKKALAFMETIRNPVERGIFAQQFFGNQDLGRIADGHLGPVLELFRKAREKLGEFKIEDVIDAEKFDRSLNSLKGSMQRLGTTIAREVLGPATDLTTWADELVSGQRADVTKSLREGLQGVKKELGEINWKQFGEDTVKGLQAGTALAGSLARTMHEIAEAIHAIRGGEYAQAARGLDGASGPLARALAPRVGDDEIDAQENVDRLRKMKEVADEAGQHLIGRTQQRLGLLPGSDQAGKDLEAAEARLKALQGRTPEQRQKDFEASEKLRKSVDGLTDEMKASRGGATVQKQSMDTQGGLFGGATVQTAAFGGGGGFRRFGGYGGGANLPVGGDDPVIHGGPQGGHATGPQVDRPRPAGPQVERRGGSGPGYRGEQGLGGLAGRSFGGGGRFNGLGGTRPSIPPIGPRPAVPSIDLPGGYTGNDGRRAARSGMTTGGRERVASWLEFMQRPIDQGGMGFTRDEAYGQIAMMQGESGLNLNPAAEGDHEDPIRKINPHAFGTVQWSDARGNKRFPMLRALAERMGKDWRDVSVQQQMYRAEMLREGRGGYRHVYDAIKRNGTGEGSLRFGINGYENPQKKDLAYAIRKPFLDRLRRDQSGPTAERADGDGTDLLPGGAPRLIRPNSMGGAPGLTMDQAAAMREGKADGAGWAAREAARKTFEAQQAEAAGLRTGGARVAATAARAGVVAMPKVENNGSVVVNVLEPGPKTRVATTASGKLFQDVVQRSGAQMRRAD
ncbi:phage tail tip lysozyme [Methylobacterium tardum]